LEHSEDCRNSIVGTPSFMSPEMLEGRPYGFKSDQWALGCVLYEIMALEPPFGGCNCYAAVVRAVLEGTEMRKPAGYSEELGSTLGLLMARKPEDRPSSAALLGGSLLCQVFQSLLRSFSDEVREVQAANMARTNVSFELPKAKASSPDAESYASDFESYSGSEVSDKGTSREDGNKKNAASSSRLAVEMSPSSVGLGEWRHLVCEAESLLQFAVQDPREERRKVWTRLCENLGSEAQVDVALDFLRQRKPLGDTNEADELVLQIEILDLLGDEGLHALPLLEKCLSLDGHCSTRRSLISGTCFSAE